MIPRDVTVVVPTRNRRDILSTTLATILGQRGVDLSVIVVDEASSDDTPALLSGLASDTVAIVRHAEPKGLAAARNAGIERACTTWVAFCDDDDLWAPDKLAAQLAEIERVGDARWACTGTVSIDTDRRVLGCQRTPPSGDVSEQLRAGNVVPNGGSTVLVDTALARELGGYDAWPTGCEDYDFHCRVAARSPIAAVDQPLVGYRVWPGSMSTDVERMQTGHFRVLERYRGDLDPALAAPQDLIAEQYWARFHLRNRERAKALRAYVDIARRYRRPMQLVYAAWGAVSPSSANRYQGAVERHRVPADWIAGAQAWLNEVDMPQSLPA